MTTQSIIVYRNPMEAYFWENNLLVPMVGVCLAFAIGFLVSTFVINKILWLTKKSYKKGFLNFHRTTIAIWVGIACSCVAFHFLAVGF